MIFEKKETPVPCFTCSRALRVCVPLCLPFLHPSGILSQIQDNTFCNKYFQKLSFLNITPQRLFKDLTVLYRGKTNCIKLNSG